MAMLRIIEILSKSKTSWKDVTIKTVKQAAKFINTQVRNAIVTYNETAACKGSLKLAF